MIPLPLPQQTKRQVFSADSCLKFLGRELSGSAEVLAYFSLACFVLRTTLRLLFQVVGLPLRFIGLCTFGCHAYIFPPTKAD
jgi:hypothetical protein